MSATRKRKINKNFRWLGMPLLSLPFLFLYAGVTVVASALVIATVVTNVTASHSPSASPRALPRTHSAAPSPTTSTPDSPPATDLPPDNGGKHGTAIGGSSTTDVIGSTSRILLSVNAGISLGPGRSSALDMSFTNEDSKAVSVNHLTVTISGISAPASSSTRTCTADDFFVTQAPAGFSVSLSPQASVTLASLGTPQSRWPVVGMLNSTSNQDGCKGATIILSYAAWGSNA